jgi:hypothetical protein
MQKLEDVLVATLEKASAVGGEIYDATKEGFAKAVDFAQGQIPDIIAQIMYWEFAYHAIYAAIYLGIFLAMFLFCALTFKKSWNNSDRYSAPFCLVTLNIIGLVVSLFFIMPAVPHIMDCVKIKVAPKVFFIEYCADLVQAQKAKVIERPDGRAGMSYYRRHNH